MADFFVQNAPRMPFAAVAAELSRWLDKLKGKRIVCPFELSPTAKTASVTIDFEHGLYYVGAVKKKASDRPYFALFDGFAVEDGRVEISERQFTDFLSNQDAANFLKYLFAVGKNAGIASVTAFGYDVATGKGVRFDEVDYGEYDVCIAAPPFDLYGSFMSALGGICKIIVAPFMDRLAPCVAVPLMERRLYLGYGRHLAIRSGIGGKKLAVDWLVSWSDAQDECDKSQSERVDYDDGVYVEMPGMTMKDGTKPIRIAPGQSVPSEYDGYMFASIAVLDKLNYGKYDWLCTGCKRYFNNDHPELNPFNHKVSNEMLRLDTGAACFHGILLWRRHIA